MLFDFLTIETDDQISTNQTSLVGGSIGKTYTFQKHAVIGLIKISSDNCPIHWRAIHNRAVSQRSYEGSESGSNDEKCQQPDKDPRHSADASFPFRGSGRDVWTRDIGCGVASQFRGQTK